MREEAIIRIERVGLNGCGVGKNPGGQILFVPGAFPGDQVRVEILPSKKRYRDAEILEILEPASERVSIDCPYFPRCGGCDWLGWKYSSQLEAKVQSLNYALSRAGFCFRTLLPVIPSSQTEYYRNRVQLRARGMKLGFYSRRSHEIVDIERCFVADEKINQEISKLRKEMLPHPRELKIELSVDNHGVSRGLNKPHSVSGFSQVNPAMNQVLKQIVREEIQRVGARRVVEFFSGNGNLTFAYCESVDQVVAYEGGVPAFEIAVQRARAKNYRNVSFIHKRLTPQTVTHLIQEQDTLVLDPPRAGTRGILKTLNLCRVENIIYVSCSVDSFISDLSSLKSDFVNEKIQPLDMFPHTHHLEFVATLRRHAVVK